MPQRLNGLSSTGLMIQDFSFLMCWIRKVLEVCIGVGYATVVGDRTVDEVITIGRQEIEEEARGFEVKL